MCRSAGHDRDVVRRPQDRPRLDVARGRVAGDDVAADEGAPAVLRVEGAAGVAALLDDAAGVGDHRGLATGGGAHLRAGAVRGVSAPFAGGPAAVAVVVEA